MRHLREIIFAPALFVAVSLATTGSLHAQAGVPTMREPSAIPSPIADDCITSVAPGDHTFTCDGLAYQVAVDEMCTRLACGLIVDMHGAGMSSRVMRDATQLHLVAPSRGYLVVHPSARLNEAGSWNLAEDPARVRGFVDRMVRAFHVDPDRIHVTGFSMGAAMTFAFLCNYADLLASTAVMTGASADQVRAADGQRRCVDSFDSAWSPRVPILFINGALDTALRPEAARARIDGIVGGLGLGSCGEIERVEGRHSWERWAGTDHMVFEFIEHQYAVPGGLAGHCIPRRDLAPGAPGTLQTNGVVCTSGDPALHWGEVALRWFEEHPRARPAARAANAAAPLPPATEAVAPRNLARHEGFVEIARGGDIDLLWIGDSITDWWARSGLPVWNEYFASLKPANFGIAGDRTQGVLWRVTNGELEGFAAKLVILMLGTNNINRNPNTEIAEGNRLIVEEIRRRQPQAKVLVLGVFPRGAAPDNPYRASIREINERLASLDDGENVFFMDIGEHFLAEDGTLPADVMPDGLHPNENGYRIWAEAIHERVRELMEE